MRDITRFNFKHWRNSLVGQLLVRFWVCHIIFFILIGSIQYHSLKSSLYQSVEQNLLSDYYSVRNSMINWLVSDDLRPSRFSELRPGNFVAFYTVEGHASFMVHSYGRTNTTFSDFMGEKLNFSLYEKALSSQPFVVKKSEVDKYMVLVKPVLASRVSSIFGQQLEDPALIIQSDFSFGVESEGIPLSLQGYAVIGEPLDEENLLLERNLKGYVFNALLILLLSTLLTAFALQKPLEPLLHMSSTARKIAGGRYNLRIPTSKTSSEFEQLQEALNHMLEQMEQALNTERTAKDRMSQFIADASHELRTPLTSIRGFLEILQRGGTTDKETLDASHKTMLIETDRLIRLTEGLLTLNRLSEEQDNNENSVAKQSTLQDVLPDLIPLFSPLLENRLFKINKQSITSTGDLSDLSIISSISHPVFPFKADELKQILYNLLNNSIQHTSPKGIIEISAWEEDGKICLAVKDNGKGIPPEDLPHIFERFFRGDRSRARASGKGSGLGLAIISELVRLRGGEIKVESDLGQGTMITICF